MADKIRTGIFGGSFNPIHYGHLAVGDFFYHSGLLDEVWFVVSPHNPLKQAEDLADARERLAQVQAALAAYPYLKVSDIELDLPRPSYMSATLRELERRYPQRTFSLIIGSDNLENFVRWHDFQYLIGHYDILVYPRPGYRNEVPVGWKRVRLFREAPQMDVSSTRIREAIRNGQPYSI